MSVTLTHHLLGQLSDQCHSDNNMHGLNLDNLNDQKSNQSPANYGCHEGTRPIKTDLEILENDIKTFLSLLMDEKFAHPYGTVAGSVA